MNKHSNTHTHMHTAEPTFSQKHVLIADGNKIFHDQGVLPEVLKGNLSYIELNFLLSFVFSLRL